ncbi:MAG: Response regulator receiver domain protein [Parcubacteria group bacterium GW2011_GWA2_37_10]|nr:MAG: Response regulator receiver domain protein [Parcubacteria group bacterium GW2011_GWA2_37_10]
MANINKKILIVEDDKNFLWILKQSFISEGFAVVTADDGEKGLESATSEKPDLILLDILMPKMDGIAVAKRLKEIGNKAQIMFLTNLKDVQHISEAVDTVKETDYIIKSDFHIDAIVAMVKTRLGIK